MQIFIFVLLNLYMLEVASQYVPSGLECRDNAPYVYCAAYSHLGLCTYRENCMFTCGACNDAAPSPASIVTPQTSTQSSFSLPDFVMRVEERLMNITEEISDLKYELESNAGEEPLTESYIRAIIQSVLFNIRNDVTALQERSVIDPASALSPSDVSDTVQSATADIRTEIADIKNQLTEIFTILIPTVPVVCSTNGELRSEGRYIAICPGNCHLAPFGVWGTDIYTSDSQLCAAAIHDGKLDAVFGGQITVLRLPGEIGYAGSTQNNITSRDFGQWDVSFSFE